jgi:predicted transcriptional regulator YdeE
MESYSHGTFEVSGYVVTIPNPQEAQTVIQTAWKKFMDGGLSKLVEHKAYEGVHAIYYDYTNPTESDKVGYKMLLGFITEAGTTQSNPEFQTITIPAQTYKYIEINGDFQKILPIEWAKINAMPKSEVDRDYGYDLEMYSLDYKTCTLAVSVNN